MAQIVAKFELTSVGSAISSSGADLWIDLLSYGPNTNSPIPSGKQIWIAYITCVAPDKSGTFQLRMNLPTKSAGNLTDTELRGFTMVPGGESRDLDIYYGGAIQILAPTTAASTGVEKVWLMVDPATANTGVYEFIVYYTLY